MANFSNKFVLILPSPQDAILDVGTISPVKDPF